MRRRWMALAILIILLAGATAPAAQAAPAQQAPPVASKSGVYIAIMELQPVIAYGGGIQGMEPTKPGKGGKVNPNSAHVKKYEALLEQQQNAAAAAVGINPADKLHSYTFALNGFAAKMTPAQAEALAAQPGVAVVLPDELRQPMTDASPAFLGLTAAGGAYARGITGENVVVGIIDTGIWPEHPSFADNGSYAPLALPNGPIPCEFGNTAHHPADAPFTCNNKLLGARQMLATYRAVLGAEAHEFDSARDDDGHGTHTASTAAGNAGIQAQIFGVPRGTVSGIAPRARVIAYKGLGELGGFTSDLAAAIDQAVTDGVDVINYSIGSSSFAIGADDLAFLFAADAGVFVATSAGNSGPGASTIGSPAAVPWLTSVGASTHNRGFISDITVSGPGTPPSGVWGQSVTDNAPVQNYRLVDAASVGGGANPRCLSAFAPGTFQATDAVLCNAYNFGVARTTLVRNVLVGGGGAVILHNSPVVNITPTDNHVLPTVHVLADVGQPLKDYIAANPGAVTVTFSPSAARYEEQDARVRANVMTSFSSRGPNGLSPDIIKPDVTAPGFSILAGASPVHSNTAAQGQLFQAIMGTSMSSPHVAGIFALVKQARPDWSPAMAKSALMTTAYQDVLNHDFQTPANPFAMGAGHVNPGGKANKGSLFEPGLVYDAGFNDYLGFLCDASPNVFANPAASCAALAGAGIATQAVNLNLASIAVSNLPGSVTVRRTVTSVASDNGWREYSVSAQAPDGYSVTVDPPTLRLKRGDRATFSVTITNVSAPAGEWRFGSLTWRDKTGHFDVRSPIAVRGSLFQAPEAISGSGESGTASFDVRFGYTGAYSAAAHGLVAATVTSDNVQQDPDQNFSPGDGFSNAHTFNLSGAAFFRIRMPPEATEADADLDIFVFNPGGQLVASSTNGGTDEQIDIANPADGTWTVFVHGWQAPGGDSDYDMYSWAISATPGGNLSIVSAPTSATVGTVETINLSWSGATVGQWHLGAVSHTGPSGLMGLTLVEVDNR